ncbi:hypothetical protein KIPB_008771, partial [Kipferlia bialata]
GGSLTRYFGKDILSEAIKVRCALHVARGLCHLHSKDIIHRDVKCENILVQRPIQAETGPEDILAKLADFGFCRIVEPRGAAMTIRGTWQFMAPEMLMHEKYTLSSDVFSFGITLAELVLEAEPDPDSNFKRNSEFYPQEAAVEGLACSKGLRSLIRSCVCLPPEERPLMHDVVRILAALDGDRVSSTDKVSEKTALIEGGGGEGGAGLDWGLPASRMTLRRMKTTQF